MTLFGLEGTDTDVTRLNSIDNIICCITSLKLLRSAPTAQREWRDFIDS